MTPTKHGTIYYDSLTHSDLWENGRVRELGYPLLFTHIIRSWFQSDWMISLNWLLVRSCRLWHLVCCTAGVTYGSNTRRQIDNQHLMSNNRRYLQYEFYNNIRMVIALMALIITCFQWYRDETIQRVIIILIYLLCQRCCCGKVEPKKIRVRDKTL